MDLYAAHIAAYEGHIIFTFFPLFPTKYFTRNNIKFYRSWNPIALFKLGFPDATRFWQSTNPSTFDVVSIGHGFYHNDGVSNHFQEAGLTQPPNKFSKTVARRKHK